MRGLIDIHCHIIPGVDDGVQTLDDAVALVRGLHQLGFDRLVATPHVHPPRWDQDHQRLLELRDEVAAAVGPNGPSLEVAAENYFDDIIWQRYNDGELLTYPGGHAALVEFGSDYDAVPVNYDKSLFEMNVHGIRPVLAHPERQDRLAEDVGALEKLTASGTVLLLSVPSFARGKILGGIRSRRAHELLQSGLATAAATDAHDASELPLVEKGLRRLEKLVGQEGLRRLLIDTPTSLLTERR